MAEGTNHCYEPMTLLPWGLPGHDVIGRRRAWLHQLLPVVVGGDPGCAHVWKRGLRAVEWHCIRCQVRRPALKTAA